jgi:GTP-binding protein EngB required for normal cell division
MKMVYAVDMKESDSRLYNQRKLFAYLFKRVSESVLVVSQSEKAWSHTGTTFPHKLLQPNLDDHIFAPQFGHVVNKLQSIEFIRDVKELRAWRSEKVLIFGRTGSGKSTIAQMLTDGELNDHPKFQAGSGAKGETRQVQRCEGRGWYVTDTPGFGEPEGGAVPTTEAANRLKAFVTKVSGTYSHFIYVLRKDRLNKYDASLWQFFKAAFEGAETNFTVVVTNCDEGFPEADENRVRKTLTGCERFFHVSFPPLDLKDAMQEEENREVRQLSLQRLEKNLSDAGLADADCFEGILAEETVMSYPTLAPVGALGGIVQDLDTAAKQAGPVIGYALETGIWMFKWQAKLAKAACHLTETPFSVDSR